MTNLPADPSVATSPAPAAGATPPATVSIQLGAVGVLQLGGKIGRLRALRFYGDAETRRFRVYALIEARDTDQLEADLRTLELAGEGRTPLEAGADLLRQLVQDQDAVLSFLGGRR